MIDSLNLFADWVFSVLTQIWNFSINNPLIKWVIAIYILNFVVKEFKKYFGK